MNDIVVLGSINMDIVTRVERHPVIGETIPSIGSQYGPGGKGANQAVAASRSGCSVTLIGAVGLDSFGAELLTLLKQAELRVEHVKQKDTLTGLALITVDESGKNHIILSSGANGKLNAEKDLPIEELDEAKALIIQNEIPWDVTWTMIQEAHKRKVKVIANPAPVAGFPVEALSLIDIVILNEHEAEAITGLAIHDDTDARKAAEQILKLGSKAVVLTLGEKGVLYTDRYTPALKREALKVDAVDTTAAGDTFIGYFVTGILSGKPIQESLDFASAAAALAVTRDGALSSIPSLKEVEAFLCHS